MNSRPNLACGVCTFCEQGKAHLCRNIKSIGVHCNGGMAEYVTVTEQLVYPLRPETDLEEGCLAEPLSCALHAVDLAGIRQGDRVAILGGGPAGLAILQLAKISGAAQVVLITRTESKRRLAARLGADHVLDPGRAGLELVERIGWLPEVVFECVGKEATMSQSLQIAGPGGTVVWFGVALPDLKVAVSPNEIFRKELKLMGSFINPFTMSRAVRLLDSGKLRVRELITHRFSIGDFPMALESYLTDPNRVKIVLQTSG